MYRDRNIKLKDALEEICKNREFIDIMDDIENTSIVINGDSKVKEIMDGAEEDAVLVKEEEWHKLAGHLQSILLQKFEEKGDAFLKVRRSANGLSAWHEVHKWYLATSGIGLTERMRELMNPKQAKSDENVFGEMEKWEDALTELRGLGASELGADYKLTAIREIATPFISGKSGLRRYEPGSEQP